MRCPRCEVENDATARFCEECGARLEMLCWACGQPITLGKKFCRSCGARLADPPSGGIPSPESYTPRHLVQKILGSKAALEGERKQVTVLFADLRQSMELFADRDPEDARKILDAVLERMMEAVHRYEGTVNQVMGDGIMALFGAPLAHEDHAVRACYAALRMQEAVQRYAAEVEPVVGVSVKIRVGLNSGQVVVRSIANDLRMDYSAVGETTHLAARMEQMTDAGSVLMTAATWRLAEPFVRIRALGRTAVKGLPEPVEIYELLGAALGRLRFHAAAAYGFTRFVGREGELGELTGALDGARTGHGRLVGVVGEPGIGKSRLVHEFTHSPRTDDWLVVEAGAVAHDKAVPYLPVVALLKSYFGIEEREEPLAVRARVTARLRALDHSLASLASPLLALLDVAVDDPQWQELASEQRRRSTLDAVKDVLLRETEIRPVLVVLEDLQWMDSETDAVLERLVECLPMARLMVLVTYRPEYQPRWANKTYYTRLTVEPLSPDSASRLLDALLGDHVSVGPLKQLLIVRTEGNPFFLEESVRMLVETAALVGSSGAYRLAHEVKTLNVAPTVQAVLASRIDRLPLEEKRLLQSASIIGKDVPLAILRSVADVGEEALRSALGHLQDAEFMYELRRLPEVGYTFKHALTHEVAYGSVLVDRRQALHARIVGTIEELYRDRLPEYAPVLAHHAVRGHVWPKAVEYLNQAASRAAGCSAHQEAVAHLEQAIGALDRLPDSRERTAMAIDLRCSMRNSLFAMGQNGQTLKYLNEAEELARGLQDRRRLGWVSCHLMVHCLLVGQYEQILTYGERARVAGKDLDDLPLQIVGNLGVGQAYHAMGQHRRALEALEQSVRPLEGQLVTQRFGMNSPPSVASHTWQAWCHAELGDFPLGLASGKEALRIAEAVKEPWSRAGARFGIGLVHLLQGSFPKAIAALAAGLAICDRFNLRTWFPPLASALGHAYCQAGDVTTGLPLIEEAVAQASSMGLIVRHSLRVCWLAEGQLATDRLTLASDTARLALRLAQDHGEQGYVAWASTVLGAVAVERGRTDEAEERYREAIRLAIDLEMRPLEARCHYGLGSLHSRVGQTSEARSQLELSVGLFQAMSMGYWTTRAARVLATLD